MQSETSFLGLFQIWLTSKKIYRECSCKYAESIFDGISFMFDPQVSRPPNGPREQSKHWITLDIELILLLLFLESDILHVMLKCNIWHDICKYTFYPACVCPCVRCKFTQTLLYIQFLLMKDGSFEIVSSAKLSPRQENVYLTLKFSAESPISTQL